MIFTDRIEILILLLQIGRSKDIRLSIRRNFSPSPNDIKSRKQKITSGFYLIRQMEQFTHFHLDPPS